MAQDTLIGDQGFNTVLLGERTFGWGTSFPSTWHANGFFLRTDLLKLYQNTGSESTPSWTERLVGTNLVWAVALAD